jgi:predicted GNAT family acetyltransferase
MVESGQGPISIARDERGEICGAIYDGPGLVFAVREPADVDAFTGHGFGGRSTRMIVGVRPAAERFWRLARGRFGTPNVIRDSQPVYALTRETFTGVRRERSIDTAVASLDELDELALHAARMAAGEFGVAPPSWVDAGFRQRTATTISAGRFWRARRNGALVFQCYVGATSPYTAQIQGVWAPPQARGRGDATAAFAVICDALLAVYPSLSLYVNAFNVRAIALYERTGFRQVGEFASLAF